MHITNCMQSIEQILTWEIFSSICPLKVYMEYQSFILIKKDLGQSY